MTNKNMSGIHAWQRNRVENSASLVKRAIDVLLSGRLKVSLTTIVLASKSVDPAGKVYLLLPSYGTGNAMRCTKNMQQ